MDTARPGGMTRRPGTMLQERHSGAWPARRAYVAGVDCGHSCARRRRALRHIGDCTREPEPCELIPEVRCDGHREQEAPLFRLPARRGLKYVLPAPTCQAANRYALRQSLVPLGMGRCEEAGAWKFQQSNRSGRGDGIISTQSRFRGSAGQR